MAKIQKTDKILVDLSAIHKLMDAFGCNKTTVYNALAFRTNSDMAKSIRKTAVDRFSGVKTKQTRIIS